MYLQRQVHFTGPALVRELRLREYSIQALRLRLLYGYRGQAKLVCDPDNTGSTRTTPVARSEQNRKDYQCYRLSRRLDHTVAMLKGDRGLKAVANVQDTRQNEVSEAGMSRHNS